MGTGGLTDRNERLRWKTERRAHPRSIRDPDVYLGGAGGDPADPEPRAVDLSAGGVKVMVAKELAPGTKLDLRMDFPKLRIQTRATVRWCAPHQFGFLCGLEFARLGWLERTRLQCLLEGSADPMDAVDMLVGWGSVVMGLLVLCDLLGLRVELICRAIQALFPLP